MRTGSANSAVLCSRKPNHNWANFNMKSDFITDIFPKIHSFYHQSSLVRGTDSIIENNMNYIVAQSICTHYSSLSGQPDIFLGSGTLKNIRLHQPNFFQSHIFSACNLQSKREEASLPLLFFE